MCRGSGSRRVCRRRPPCRCRVPSLARGRTALRCPSAWAAPPPRGTSTPPAPPQTIRKASVSSWEHPLVEPVSAWQDARWNARKQAESARLRRAAAGVEKLKNGPSTDSLNLSTLQPFNPSGRCARCAGGEWEGCGREATGTGRKPLRGRERAWRADFLRQLGQLGTTFSRCTGRREGNGWESGWIADGMAGFQGLEKMPRVLRRLGNGLFRSGVDAVR